MAKSTKQAPEPDEQAVEETAPEEETTGETESFEMRNIDPRPPENTVNVIDTQRERLEDRMAVRAEGGSNKLEELTNADLQPGEQTLS